MDHHKKFCFSVSLQETKTIFYELTSFIHSRCLLLSLSLSLPFLCVFFLPLYFWQSFWLLHTISEYFSLALEHTISLSLCPFSSLPLFLFSSALSLTLFVSLCISLSVSYCVNAGHRLFTHCISKIDFYDFNVYLLVFLPLPHSLTA